MKNIPFLKLSALGILVLLSSGCGRKSQDLRHGSDSIARPTARATINLTSQTPSVFSYTAHIDECDSGFSALNLTEANTTVALPLGDGLCVFKIDQLTVDAVSFAPVGGESWAEGDEYFWTSGTNVLRLAIASTLDPMIEGPQSVEIAFSMSSSGTDVPVTPSTDASIDISELSPLNLEVNHVNVGVTSAGAGVFLFTLGCLNPVTGTLCDDVEMTSLKSSLIVDTNAGAIDIESCLAEVEASGSPVTPFGTDPNAPNGGVRSARHTGPAPMYAPANRHLLLLLSDSIGRCKYYQVEINLP